MSRTGHLGEDLLIDLACGLAPEPSASRARTHLRVCPDCEARLRAVAADRERAIGLDAVPRARGARRTWALGSVAAVFLAGVATLLLLARPAPVPVGTADAWRLPLAGEFTTLRSDAGTIAPQIAAGLEAYRRGRFDEAVERLSGIDSPPEYAALRNLYLASALGASGRAARARAIVDGLPIEVLPEPWRSRARWIDYVSARDTGRADRAAITLERLREADGPMGDRARAEIRRNAARPSGR